MADVSRRVAIGTAMVLGAGAPAFAQRAGAGDAGAQALLPPPGRPAAPRPVFVYDALVWLAETVPHGVTPIGRSFRAPITGGAFAGPDFRGRVVPGGADWQLQRTDRYFELCAEYFMETDDGVQIRVVNRGLWYGKTDDWPADYAVSTPSFEVAEGRYAWLNRHIFTGTIAPVEGPRPGVRIAVYKLV